MILALAFLAFVSLYIASIFSFNGKIKEANIHCDLLTLQLSRAEQMIATLKRQYSEQSEDVQIQSMGRVRAEDLVAKLEDESSFSKLMFQSTASNLNMLNVEYTALLDAFAAELVAQAAEDEALEDMYESGNIF